MSLNSLNSKSMNVPNKKNEEDLTKSKAKPIVNTNFHGQLFYPQNIIYPTLRNNMIGNYFNYNAMNSIHNPFLMNSPNFSYFRNQENIYYAPLPTANSFKNFSETIVNPHHANPNKKFKNQKEFLGDIPVKKKNNNNNNHLQEANFENKSKRLNKKKNRINLSLNKIKKSKKKKKNYSKFRL